MKRDCKICKYIFNILVAIDQLANTLLGGDPDETISSRAGKLQHRVWWASLLCKILNKLDYKHCQNSKEGDEGKNRIVE